VTLLFRLLTCSILFSLFVTHVLHCSVDLLVFLLVLLCRAAGFTLFRALFYPLLLRLTTIPDITFTRFPPRALFGRGCDNTFNSFVGLFGSLRICCSRRYLRRAYRMQYLTIPTIPFIEPLFVYIPHHPFRRLFTGRALGGSIRHSTRNGRGGVSTFVPTRLNFPGRTVRWTRRVH